MIEILFLALSAATSCSLRPQIPVPERPRDPWVFRSVLDGKPRIVTMALSKEMYLAYDAQTCGMYKCWKGGVELKGAVYTTVHGDQPVSYGDVYTHGLEGDVWSAEVGGKPQSVRARWMGYFFGNKRVNLLYEIRLEGGQRITVQESTEFTSSELLLNPKDLDELLVIEGTPVLLRTWRTEAIPPGVTLVLSMRLDSDVMQRRVIFPEGCLRKERIVEASDPAVKPHSYILSELPFSEAMPSAYIWAFFEPLADATPPEKGAPAPKKAEASSKPAADEKPATSDKKGG